MSLLNLTAANHLLYVRQTLLLYMKKQSYRAAAAGSLFFSSLLILHSQYKCVSHLQSICALISHSQYKGILHLQSICALPVYLLSSKLMPVTLEIEKLIRLFLWGTRDGVCKLQLAAWEGVCLPTSMPSKDCLNSILCNFYYANGCGDSEKIDCGQ